MFITITDSDLTLYNMQ